MAGNGLERLRAFRMESQERKKRKREFRTEFGKLTPLQKFRFLAGEAGRFAGQAGHGIQAVVARLPKAPPALRRRKPPRDGIGFGF